jgi:hypothetical protein
VCRRLAEEPLVDEIVRDVTWDVPLRLLGGLHELALETGVAPWDDLPDVLAEHRDRLARFVAERSVQTNEVQRAWALLPAFLLVAREAARPLELLELGPAGGLNLLWNRYGYRYANGEWGDETSPLVLDGDERTPIPGDVLAQRVEVVRRRGVDLDPIDVTRPEGARRLECFVWADQTERMERLRRAIDVVRRDPPELIAGDYVELLPSLLADRRDDMLTVVFQTVSTVYLSDDDLARLRATLDDAGRAGPLAWISTRRFDEASEEGLFFEVEVAMWPRGERRVVSLMHVHGQWLDWRG